MDREGKRTGCVELPQMEVLPVHLSPRPAVGERHLPQGGQRHQCGTQKEGRTWCRCYNRAVMSTVHCSDVDILMLCASVGAVPVCAAHRYPLLPAASGSVAPGGEQRPRDTALPAHHCGGGGAGSEKRCHPLLDVRKTEVHQHQFCF